MTRNRGKRKQLINIRSQEIGKRNATSTTLASDIPKLMGSNWKTKKWLWITKWEITFWTLLKFSETECLNRFNSSLIVSGFGSISSELFLVWCHFSIWDYIGMNESLNFFPRVNNVTISNIQTSIWSRLLVHSMFLIQ